MKQRRSDSSRSPGPAARSGAGPLRSGQRREAESDTARLVDASPRQVAQRSRIESVGGPLQKVVLEDEEPRQAKTADRGTGASAASARGRLPPALRAGAEAMSGLDLSDVRVHRGSSEPSRIRAHAFAQGDHIHLATGQERHLPHETWHVVQQRQGRVQPTGELAGGVAINDDAGLEREADVMGARALHHGREPDGR